VRFLLLPLFFLLLFTLTGEFAGAQNNQENGISEADENKVVRKVRFTGNSNVSNRSLRTLVRTRTNREFLGIPRFTPWYYIHNVFGVGESPSLLNREVVSSDIDRIRIYYENLGFFNVQVDTTIIEYRPRRVEVSFIIREGPMSRINSVSYTGIPDFEDERLKEEFLEDSRFSGRSINDSTFSVNRQYKAQELREEQTRIITFLRNNGFASVQRDSVRALVKPSDEGQNRYDILYSIQPGGFYTFGDVFITLSGPEGPNNFDEEQVLEGPPHTLEGHKIEMRKQDAAQTRFGLLSGQLQFTPGETFNQSQYLRTVNAYQNLGMIVMNRFGLSEDGSLPDYSKSEIPVYLEMQTLPKHSIRAELFGMRRYGFGTGAGVVYNNNNLFGRAENFSLSVNGNIEFVPSGAREVGGSTIFRTFETRAEYSLPRLNFPFGAFQNRSWVQSSRTLYSLSYSQASQEFFDVNSDIRLNLRYEVMHSQRLRSFLDMIELDVVDIGIADDFRSSILRQFNFFDEEFDDLTPNQIAEIENRPEVQLIFEDFRPQFSSIVRYTLRSQNTNLIKRNYGYFSEFSFAVGGNLPYAIDRFLISPGDIEGNVSLPLGIFPSDLSYSRFFKFSADYRRYFTLSPNAVAAFRLFGGYAQPFGGSDNIPVNRRFFAGGSNDIRGYAPFGLGPGAIPPGELSIPGGEVKLAAFTELRQIFMRDVFNAQWYLAWHTDAGNVWYGPRNRFLDDEDQDILEEGRFSFDTFYKQIPVSTGIGIRLDWEFFVARFDVTFRARDLERGWFNDGSRYFSFGIGHSF
jgi:outer membrane protein insertion porin family